MANTCSCPFETHNDSDYQLQGEAMYDGDGQRVQTVAYVMGIPLTTTYSLDRRSGNPLLVDSGGSQRAILYGLFALGEVGDSDWHYYRSADAHGRPGRRPFQRAQTCR
jgi:hypothetical protein